MDIAANPLRMISPAVAFLIVSFSLGELGDGLNIFQGIYLVNIGWNEGAVGTALSMMGFTALIVQTFAGDWVSNAVDDFGSWYKYRKLTNDYSRLLINFSTKVDKTNVDRRLFLSAASILTALSASTIFFVQGNSEHGLIYVSKVVEGIASSFIGPCLSALVLATFGPHHFDAIMASNTLWGHIGSVVAAFLAGSVAYFMYPNIKLCFLVIAASAVSAVFFIGFLPEGDKLMGRGFMGKQAMDRYGHVENLVDENGNLEAFEEQKRSRKIELNPKASSYWEVISDKRCFLLCITGFFFQ